MSPRKPKPPPPKWYESRANQVVLAAAALAALTYFFGALKPVVDSGPMPFPARSELGDLHKDFEGHLNTIDKTLNETLEAAKAANSTAQQAIAQTNDYRLDRLLGQKIELENQIKLRPGDLSLQTALAHVLRDIDSLPMPKK